MADPKPMKGILTIYIAAYMDEHIHVVLTILLTINKFEAYVGE